MITQVQTQAPSNNSNPDGSNPNWLGGKAGEGVVTELHGKYYTAAYRGKVFFGTATGVTIPHIASALVSVFSLYNPANSGVNLELIWTELAPVSATTVLDNVGWYWQAGSTFTVPTSITQGTVNCSLLGGAKGAGQFLTAATHTGTPALLDYILGMLTTSTVPGNNVVKARYDGEIILPPGSIISLAADTAAWTASGMSASVGWSEWPL